jgi:hypothetical protein
MTCTKQYNCRSGFFDSELNSNTPAAQYQRQKIIQNTVRVPESIYVMNLGALSVYQRPKLQNQLVNWNQMSDRAVAHVQQAGASGSTYGGNSLRRSLTRLRPGALSPGGVGVDIKHNSYDRYLARIKGKGPLRQEIIPSYFGVPEIRSTCAVPIYGGKTMKTNIINGCECVDDELAIYKLYNEQLHTDLRNALYNVQNGYSNKTDCTCPKPPPAIFNEYYGLVDSLSYLYECRIDLSGDQGIHIL